MCANPVDEPEFRLRFRFALSKRLNIQEVSRELEVCDRKVVVWSGDRKSPIADSDWLDVRADGFTTLEDAKAFGEKLKIAAAVASLKVRLGVDVGNDKPTTTFSQAFKDAFFGERGEHLRDDVHGVDAYENVGTTLFGAVNAAGTAHADPAPFMDNIKSVAEGTAQVPESAMEALALLNASLMSREPMAQLVLAVAAVEMLSGGERWTDAQLKYLKLLKKIAQETDELEGNEKTEVIDAIARSYRISIRQAVKRLLKRLDLEHLWKAWDALYDKRSSFFHGGKRAGRVEQIEAAQSAVTISARVVLKELAAHVPEAAVDVDLYFPMQDTHRAMLAVERDAEGNLSASLRPPLKKPEDD